MRLLTLIEHCGQLINIIYKSNLPADKNAAEYFRSKRHIGSKERKFIAETVFSSIRNILLLQNILKMQDTDEHSYIYTSINQYYCQQKHDFSIIALIQLILAENYHGEFYFNPTELLKKINSHCDNILQVVYSELSHISISYESCKNWIYNITNSFEILCKNISNEAEIDFNFIETKFSIPRKFLELVINNYSTNSLKNVYNLAKELNKPAKTCIRINTLNSTKEKITEYFLNNNIEHSIGSLSPHCIILNKRIQLHEISPYINGEFEVQDEASQLVAFCVNPKENDNILDACAGAGGKSLHLANLQNDKGNILATDIEFMRLKEIHFRAKRCNITSIKSLHLKNKNDANAIFLQNKKSFSNNAKQTHQTANQSLGLFDIVLVDAPCSGSGTIRREPMKKYTITENAVKKIAEQQYNIITNFSKFVKPDGYLIYSTCSILAQENEFVVKRFLENNPGFAPEPLKPNLDKYGIKLPDLNENDYYITLFPHIHQTDGFFISRMKRL